MKLDNLLSMIDEGDDHYVVDWLKQETVGFQQSPGNHWLRVDLGNLSTSRCRDT